MAIACLKPSAIFISISFSSFFVAVLLRLGLRIRLIFRGALPASLRRRKDYLLSLGFDFRGAEGARLSFSPTISRPNWFSNTETHYKIFRSTGDDNKSAFSFSQSARTSK